MTQKIDRKFSELKNRDLDELMSLIHWINRLVKNYSHVSEYIPNSVTESINNFQSELKDEHDRRILQPKFK
jgi:hypothetical protein